MAGRGDARGWTGRRGDACSLGRWRCGELCAGDLSGRRGVPGGRVGVRADGDARSLGKWRATRLTLADHHLSPSPLSLTSPLLLTTQTLCFGIILNVVYVLLYEENIKFSDISRDISRYGGVPVDLDGDGYIDSLEEGSMKDGSGELSA